MSGVVAGAGEADVLRGGALRLVGDGLALLLVDGEGDGEAVGVPEGDADGVALGVDEGDGGGVLEGDADGVALGDGVADEPVGDGLGAGDASAGATKARVEAAIAPPGRPDALAPAALADNVAEVATAALEDHAIVATAPAVMAPRTVRMPRLGRRAAAADRRDSPLLPESADIRPPYLDHPDIQPEQV